MPTNKRMGLHSAEDLLRKLRWEVGEMEHKIGKVPDNEVEAYHAFNAAVTAWHICDGFGRRLPWNCEHASSATVRSLRRKAYGCSRRSYASSVENCISADTSLRVRNTSGWINSMIQGCNRYLRIRNRRGSFCFGEWGVRERWR
jgi:hypothetical protein